MGVYDDPLIDSERVAEHDVRRLPPNTGKLDELFHRRRHGSPVTLGHCYPVFQKFKGGKGVATLTGVFGALLPALLPWLILTFALVLMLTGYVSLASISGGVIALLIVACYGSGLWSPAGGFTAAMLALILFKHRDNIGRLFAGTESRFEKARVLGKLFERAPRA